MQTAMLRNCAAKLKLFVLLMALAHIGHPMEVSAAAAPPDAAPNFRPEVEYGFARQFYLGEGVPQNFDSAAYWYHRAADDGYPPAQLALARCYVRGVGVPRDFVLAYAWADIAVSRLPPETPERDAAVRFRDFVGFRLPQSLLQTAQSLAGTWRPGLPGPMGGRPPWR